MRIQDEFKRTRNAHIFAVMAATFIIILTQPSPYTETARIVFIRICHCMLYMILLFSYSSTTRAFILSEEGITVVWLGFAKQRYPWGKFVDIAIITVKVAKAPDRKFIVCSTKKYKHKTRQCDWFLFHLNTALFFLFTPERYEYVITNRSKWLPRI